MTIRVASYCRVSTDHTDQMNSLESQQRFFREYIERHPDWELHEVYADEGVTGTSTRKRTEFNRMISDAYGRNFDLILTKEVSRFSRNILDTISYTRELKKLGIGVVFLTDGFCSLDPDAELRLSIMGSIAQEESRKTSERVKWGQERQMERGVVFGTSLLGYTVHQGRIEIEPNGAETVKLIFHKYGVEKKGTSVIARELGEAGYTTYSGSLIWNSSQILKILKNEKYVGDLVQKKTFTPDYLTHTKKVNKGEVGKIIIHKHHEAIITRELWNTVQEEILKRSRKITVDAGRSCRYAFSGKIRCGGCGATFIARKKVRKDGTAYQFWSCYNAVKHGKRKKDSVGNELGCNIGRTISSKRLYALVGYCLSNLPAHLQPSAEAISRLIVQHCSHDSEHLKRLQIRVEQISRKKEAAIDAYLSGIFSHQEFAIINNRYDSEISILQQTIENELTGKALREIDLQQLIRTIEQILTGKTASEIFCKLIVQDILVRESGTIEIKFQHLPIVWRFQI